MIVFVELNAWQAVVLHRGGGQEGQPVQIIPSDAVSFNSAFFFMHVSKSRGSPTFALSPVSFCTADPTANILY